MDLFYLRRAVLPPRGGRYKINRRRRDVTFATGQGGPCIQYPAGVSDAVHTLPNAAGATRMDERPVGDGQLDLGWPDGSL
jgi:hypothetical protein